MKRPYEAFWPKRLPKELDYPCVPLHRLIEVSCELYAPKTAINFYGNEISYDELGKAILHFAGSLQAIGIQPKDKVALYLQNSPQFIIGMFGTMKAGGVVVPLNPMLTESELPYFLKDSETRFILTSPELANRAHKASQSVGGVGMIVGSYRDFLPKELALPVPSFMTAEAPIDFEHHDLGKLLKQQVSPKPVSVSQDDLCMLPYTSGTTGIPKACMHTYRTVIPNPLSSYFWLGVTPKCVGLATLPLFHVTGLVHSLLAPLIAGGTIILMTRWDRKTALEAIQGFKVSHWVNISTMVIDLMSDPELSSYDLSSLVAVGGGGAPLPQAIGKKLKDILRLEYVEGYGLTETMSQTHFNPPDRPKLQCIGIPDFGVDSRIIEPGTTKELGPNEAGELVVSGPEVFLGYLNKPEDTKEAFIELGGKRFFRTGDIVTMDEEGYFFIVERLKRMINAAGFKVWPTEVEGELYHHPAIKEACVVGIPDPVRIENVRAYVVLKDEFKGKTGPEEIIAWGKGRMAAYKYPKEVLFVDELPKTATGKLNWRFLQEEARKEKQVD